MCDPPFAEAFNHGKKMTVAIEKTEKGVKVVGTSDDAEESPSAVSLRDIAAVSRQFILRSQESLRPVAL